jgi:hypothetical protein
MGNGPRNFHKTIVCLTFPPPRAIPTCTRAAPNKDLQTREHLTEAEVERLIKATQDNRYSQKRSTGDYAVIGLTDKIVSGYHPSRRPCRVFFASLGMETFHTLSTLAHALFRYRLVSSFAQTPRVEAPTNEAGERAAPPLIGRPL